MLVVLRDRGLPLPAGAILISPWVDLTHSFPSVAGNSTHDYIPAHGFLQRPSAAWPPPSTEDMKQIAQNAVRQVVDEALPRKSNQYGRKRAEDEAVRGFSVDHSPQNSNPVQNASNSARSDGAGDRRRDPIPSASPDLSITVDGKLIYIKDQIQMYTTNQLISHPLVSPVLQPSLGGLPPLLIMTGGGEVLRDEQIYLAHKAANPAKYPLGDGYLDENFGARDKIPKWRPTDVQLQVWDDLCHVAPTLSFTRPAKYMYRSIAQFGAWALARAQHTEIEIQDDDDISIISSGSDSGKDSDIRKTSQTRTTRNNGIVQGGTATCDRVGKAGQPLPPFKSHMIRQRVNRHGHIFPLDPPSALPALQMSADEIGVIKPGPVQRWLNAKQQWDQRYAKEKRKVQKQRVKEMAKGFQGFDNDDAPPPSALAGRRGLNMPKEEKKGRSWGMSLWSLWGSSHDEDTIEREEKADKEIETTAATETDAQNVQSVDLHRLRGHSRSKSRRRTVTDAGQTNDLDIDENTPAAVIEQKKAEALQKDHSSKETAHLAPPVLVTGGSSSNDSARPSAGGRAFPFKLGTHVRDDGRNASTITLMSQGGAITPKGDERGKQLGAVADDATPKGDEKGKQLGEGYGVAGLDRRTTMEDADGVLHKRLVEREIAGSSSADDAGVTAAQPRPGVERFETAKEDIV